MFLVIKMNIEESIKNSETLIWSFDNFEDAKKLWEEEVSLMKEDAEEFGAEFDVSEVTYEAQYDDGNMCAIVTIREISEDKPFTVITF